MPSEPSSRASGVTPARSAPEQAVEQRLADARAARADLVGAHGHRRAHHLDASAARRRRRRGCARSRHWWSPASSSCDGAERSEPTPGARAVEQLAAVEQVAHEPLARPRLRSRAAAREARLRPAAGDRDDAVDRERAAVELDDGQVRARHVATVPSRAVRIATWNVNSVKQRLPRLLPWLDEREPDVVCLQETKLADEAFAELLDAELSAARLRGRGARRGRLERRRDPLARRAGGRRARDPRRPGLPGARGARGGRDLRRAARRVRLRAQRALARLRPLRVQARVAAGAARDGRAGRRAPRSCAAT